LLLREHKDTGQNVFWHSALLELKELTGLLPVYKYRLTWEKTLDIIKAKSPFEGLFCQAAIFISF